MNYIVIIPLYYPHSYIISLFEFISYNWPIFLALLIFVCGGGVYSQNMCACLCILLARTLLLLSPLRARSTLSFTSRSSFSQNRSWSSHPPSNRRHQGASKRKLHSQPKKGLKPQPSSCQRNFRDFMQFIKKKNYIQTYICF